MSEEIDVRAGQYALAYTSGSPPAHVVEETLGQPVGETDIPLPMVELRLQH